ncbi:MAG: 2Fe-2S iron-sulfur cluster binding domain-containing protein [Rhodospirillaceae bacterium]|jgi:NAD(P)H-flavin reductase/ferredoxin|nr:2Fe-2S iron-sulfur cluster binding domain-containing protein [Rhodospirillaceae bacterium]MBT4427633.1 2Fe-2S iron-sulfur cluster binding domain-containing protein [Rhodospirillaceae bacterium]MBT5037857.1 2Fe-2S iron-sulfur cluster binding domain-containing protein [Rhodospirillaceae bacterium]MBT5781133.1 2Fe-2S iron-sulfur cluster binding domain-containing protein [Rhodospirillaceae bacterium]MBT6829857.1 2Fe-2S iron-sulfur cluster binding domain-containing protein [Rhodospirillaceae bact
MANIHYYNRTFPCAEGQTVLDVLLENEQEVPHSCKMGVCVTCIMQAEEGDVPEAAQAGLRQSLVAEGNFLPCVCQPTSDMRVANTETEDLFSPAVVRGIDYLSQDICRVFLEPTTPLYYHAGQFMNLRRADGLVRSFSLASVPSLNSRLEFHIKRLDQGQMSNWILDELKIGDRIGIQGPIGNCYYHPGRRDQNMLLIGNGTGLAPLIGIARDALSVGHSGTMRIYHGSRTSDGIYLGSELRALDSGHTNVDYIPCVSRVAESEAYRLGRADQVAFSDNSDLAGWRVFLCGNPEMVDKGQELARAAGAGINDIYTDPYVLKNLREKPRA